MSRRLIIRAEAESDLADAVVWYEEREAGLGGELTTEVGAAIQLAMARPLSFRRLRKRPEVRRVLTRRFPYRILFIVRTDAIVVVAILHGARHDRRWRKRV